MVPIAGGILDHENVAKCGPVWGLNSEGEVRGEERDHACQCSKWSGLALLQDAWRHSGHRGCWFMPGESKSACALTRRAICPPVAVCH
ncbi:hypothetical protein P389DRAFT_176092 [Cystobasidium minutum MCA 4210]|uniref:uncharacterized protein n=1 Tax=Cystobasidium minutum MCA 4210 TaxID=1397322 RepID=UPI0034CEA513|eukprot:jgi/Rhomi1/176092/fgenesh1_kg.12_\